MSITGSARAVDADRFPQLLRASAAAGFGLILAFISIATASAQQATLPQEAISAIRGDVAQRALVDASSVQILRVEEVTWSNACLGVQASGEACAEVLTNGFVAWAQGNDVAYRYHTDLAGSNVRFAVGDLPPGDVPSAPLPGGATPRAGGGTGGGALIAGEVPGAGQIGLLVVTQASTVEAVLENLASGGCDASTLAITRGGAWRVYIIGAPAAVNAEFGSNLQATTPFFVRCA